MPAGLFSRMSPLVKVFGCRPLTDDVMRSGGRRSKTSKGGTAEGDTYEGAAGADLWGFEIRVRRNVVEAECPADEARSERLR